MKTQMTYILTTCGLSILTNGLNGIFTPKEIFQHANHSKDEIDKDVLAKFDREIEKLKQKITTFDHNKLKKLSAELNALLSYYDNHFDTSHVYRLLHTDTYLGKKTADIIEYYLRSQGVNVTTYTATDLKTANLEALQLALSDVVKELSEEIEGYRNNDYKIVFNLTGGFKGINSFLQTMASLYADESIYIFETGDELLRIPRMPIKIDEMIFEKNIKHFRALDIGIDINPKKLENIQKTLINKVDNEYTLSAWGEIVWQKYKISYYGKNGLDSLTGKIEYSDSFSKDFTQLSKKEKYQLNKSIDALEKYIAKKVNLQSFRYHKLTGKIAKHYSHEFYPFDGNDSRRCYCNEKGGKIILERIAAHLK
ncbi:MAG: putative CRISPR-associated protein [Endozoicomonadaceae bacterium]|nr:putative CRISPR-associated protein [Endozoicomonadaceae bacterium]